MGEWAYRFTAKKRSQPDTEELARRHAFLARSAYNKSERKQAINNVRKVRPDDIVHVYYVTRKGATHLGSYRVRDPREAPARFGTVWEGSGLARLRHEVQENASLLDLLQRNPSTGEGYRPDPKLGVFTGWWVEHLPHRRQPPYEDIPFVQDSVVRLPAALLERMQGEDALLSRVVHDPDVMGGKPCIRGTRVTVGVILGLLASGHSFEEILADFPYLQELDLRAALAYAAWRVEERDFPLEAA